MFVNINFSKIQICTVIMIHKYYLQVHVITAFWKNKQTPLLPVSKFESG